MLCEVVVGEEKDQLQLYDADHNLHTKFKKSTNAKLSTVGLGASMPDPEEDIVHEDVTVPIGEMIGTKRTNPSKNGYLLQYNEYIVYDTSQIRLKYLIKTKFNYNTRW